MAIVWYTAIPAGYDQHIMALFEKLTMSEKKAAGAIKNLQHWQQNVVSRYLLRQCIGEILNLEPSDFSIFYPKDSQPKLEWSESESYVNLSLSHSSNWVAISLGINCEIGIDILDSSRPIKGISISEQYFHNHEQALLKQLNPDQSRFSFQKLWCAKEAMKKISGLHLSECLALDLSTVLKGKMPVVLDGFLAHIIQNPKAFTLGVLVNKSENINTGISIEYYKL